MMRQRAREDRGVGTVLGIALGLALTASGIVIAGMVSARVTHQRAAVAADAAALAAAIHGCEVADRVGRAHGALSVSCEEDGADAIVTVALPAPVLLQRLAAWSGREAPAIASSARAGPP